MADKRMMTSAYANKMLKKLNEDKEFWCNKESDGFMYVALSMRSLSCLIMILRMYRAI